MLEMVEMVPSSSNSFPMLDAQPLLILLETRFLQSEGESWIHHPHLPEKTKQMAAQCRACVSKQLTIPSPSAEDERGEERLPWCQSQGPRYLPE